jgi:hypothetical protein
VLSFFNVLANNLPTWEHFHPIFKCDSSHIHFCFSLLGLHTLSKLTRKCVSFLVCRKKVIKIQECLLSYVFRIRRQGDS